MNLRDWIDALAFVAFMLLASSLVSGCGSADDGQDPLPPAMAVVLPAEKPILWDLYEGPSAPSAKEITE